MNYRSIMLLTVMLVGFGSAAQRPGATFLLIPPGAKATGMAYAYTAVCDDASANYYNTAGLAFFESPKITANYCGYLTGLHPDMHYGYFSMTCPLFKSVWGFDVIFFTPGKSDVYDEHGRYVGEHLVWRIAPKISYARKMNKKLSFGMGWKFIYLYIDHPDWVFGTMPELGIEKRGSGVTYAFDVGVLYKPIKFLSVAGALQNIGPDISYTESGLSDPLPYTIRMGVRLAPINSNVIRVNLAAELTKVLVGMFAQEEKSFWENLTYEFDEAWKGVGLELTFYKILSLRGGYFYDKEGIRGGYFYGRGRAREGLTFGGGINVAKIELDIGINENIFDFPTQNRKISLAYTF